MTRSWVWLALVEVRPVDATAAAPATEDAEPAGWLAVWDQQRRPVRGARRAWARIVDPRGEAALVSLVLPPDGIRVPVDDLSVQHARRAVLAGRPTDAVSMLLRDASRFEGSITVTRGSGARRSDPFSRVFPARRLEVGPGLFGRVAPPAGPAIERYGSANPWPADRFAP